MLVFWSFGRPPKTLFRLFQKSKPVPWAHRSSFLPHVWTRPANTIKISSSLHLLSTRSLSDSPKWLDYSCSATLKAYCTKTTPLTCTKYTSGVGPPVYSWTWLADSSAYLPASSAKKRQNPHLVWSRVYVRNPGNLISLFLLFTDSFSVKLIQSNNDDDAVARLRIELFNVVSKQMLQNVFNRTLWRENMVY